MSCLNNNDVRKLPAFSEEHFEGIKWLATSMFLMGRSPVLPSQPVRMQA